MVANLIAAFRKRIEALSWMDASTKAEAEAKLSTLYVGVGYPETWHDYSNFEVKPDDIFGNIWRGNLSDYQRQIARLGKPVDRKEWSMTPQTVNAVNLPLQNALNFPAAILQPPFYDPQAPAADNYGAIGTVIGHEISHTFDSEGAAFDSKGRLRNWWTPEDLKHFEAATAQLAAQYDTYKPFPDLAINGKQTLAENIADVAGIAAAYDGYRASLSGKPAPVARWILGRSAVLSCVRPELGREDAGCRAAAAGDDRSACSRRVPGCYGPQHRCLVRGVRCESGRETVSGAGGARSDLVRPVPAARRMVFKDGCRVMPAGSRSIRSTCLKPGGIWNRAGSSGPSSNWVTRVSKVVMVPSARMGGLFEVTVARLGNPTSCSPTAANSGFSTGCFPFPALM